MYLIKKKKKEKILQHGRFIFVSEPWNMKWYKPHFCYIYVLFQHYILYRFISFHFKFNLTGFSNSTGLPLFDTPIIHSKFQIYNFILEELKFIITKIKNWIIYIYIYNISHKAYKRIYQNHFTVILFASTSIDPFTL